MKGVDFAKQYKGMHEVRDRKALMSFFKANSIKNDILVDPSTTPWCACFINATERAAGNAGTGKQNARSFLSYGQKVNSIKDAKIGDILVFTRGGSTWQGHVSYYYGMYDANTILCLGGNQSDSVCVSYYPVSRLIGIRRP